jgi:hypothetical protein
MNDILMQNDILFSVRSSGAVCEAKIENNLPLRIHDQWVTIGDENKPWHIHVNIHDTVEARFVKEDKAGNKKVTYSIRFFDVNGGLVLRANFINMYDDTDTLIEDKATKYDNLFLKYGGKETVPLVTKQNFTS